MNKHSTIDQTQSSETSQTPGRPWMGRPTRLIGYLVGIFLTVGLVVFGFWVVTTIRGSTPSAAATSIPPEEPMAVIPPALQREIVTEEGLTDRLGVKLVYVAITGGGGLIDLRFQVVDPAKAAGIHDQDARPVILDTATGLVVDQFLMGHEHSGDYEAGKTYYLIFQNPGNIVQRGGTVSVLLGDAEVDNIVVR